MSSSTKRSSLILVAALAGTFGLVSPAIAVPGIPAAPITDPLPPPPGFPDDLTAIAHALDAEILQRSAAEPEASESPENTENRISPADPTNFEAIEADPGDYGIPASAERFRTEDGHVIPRPISGGVAAGAVRAGQEDFYTQQVLWESCDLFGAAADLQCAYVIVPLDYTDPTGSTIAIAVSKRKATSETPMGSIIVNPGGPGTPGVGLANAPMFDDLASRFDIVGFDPRGVGASVPVIRCESSQAADLQRQGTDELTSEQYDAIVEYNTNECYTNTAAEFGASDVIDQMGTVNVVKDLDIIRSVLGDSSLNFMGVGYGTTIAYEYARKFPDNIRAIVVDGAFDALANNPAEREKYAEFSPNAGLHPALAQIAGFQAKFEEFLNWCATTLEEECALVEPGDVTTTDSLLDRYQDLARAAWGGTTYATYDGRALSFADFTQATIMAMYSTDFWRALNTGLAQIKADPTSDFVLITLADIYAGRSELGTYALSTAAYPTIMCTDDGPKPGFNDDPDAQMEFLAEYFEAAPFLDPRTDAEPERGMVATQDQCTFYAERFTLPAARTLKAMPNTLTIATTSDLVSPVESGVMTAAALGGTLLIAATPNYSAFGTLECASDIVEEYFTTLRVPADITGAEATTKDIHSETVTGTECTVLRDFRPVTELESGAGEAGDTVTLRASGLVRGREYVASWKYGSIALSSDTSGTSTVAVPIPKNAEAGNHKIVLAPGIEGASDPTVRTSAILSVGASAGAAAEPAREAVEPAREEAAEQSASEQSASEIAAEAEEEGASQPDTPVEEESGPATLSLPEPEPEETADEAITTLPNSELGDTGVNVGKSIMIAFVLVALGGIGVFLMRKIES